MYVCCCDYLALRLLPGGFGILDRSTSFEVGHECQTAIAHQALRFLDGEQVTNLNDLVDAR